jgi:hypothetical protein
MKNRPDSKLGSAAIHVLLAGVILLRFETVAAVYTYDVSGNPISVSAGTSQPNILTPPASEVISGNQATLSVIATGTGLSYQWLSNGVAIVGATGDSLSVINPALTGTNLGTYSVIVSNVYGAVTSTPAALWPDANANGIPDWWEMYYFGNLKQTALGDYDNDGVDNLDEYLEGTNPTNRLSFNPRLFVQAARGSVMLSPSQPYYTIGQLVTLTASPDAGQGFVGWSGAATGNKPSISLLMSTNKTVTANFGFPLAQALDNINLVWTTTGNELWFGQAEVSHDGVSAAQSGPIVSYWDGTKFVGDQTSLQTSFFLQQPGQLSFWWSVSSQPPDGVSFSINSNVVATLSGQSVPWQFVQTNLAIGSYTLTWTYSKGPVDIPNAILFTDAAWVDQVSLTSSAQAIPALSTQLTGANSLLISWPVTSTVFRLQQTPTLNPIQWTTTTNNVSVVNGTYQVQVSTYTSSQFYRLVYP